MFPASPAAATITAAVAEFVESARTCYLVYLFQTGAPALKPSALSPEPTSHKPSAKTGHADLTLMPQTPISYPVNPPLIAGLALNPKPQGEGTRCQVV